LFDDYTDGWLLVFQFAQWHHPVVGLPHVHPAGEIRRAWWPSARDLLPLAAAPVCLWRRWLQNQGKFLLSARSHIVTIKIQATLFLEGRGVLNVFLLDFYVRSWPVLTNWCAFPCCRSGIINRNGVFSLWLVTWTTSGQQCSIMNTRGSSVLLMIKQSGFGTGKAALAYACSLVMPTMSCAPSSTPQKTLLYQLLWTRLSVSGIFQVLPASTTAKVNISTCQRSGCEMGCGHFPFWVALWLFLFTISCLLVSKFRLLCFILMSPSLVCK